MATIDAKRFAEQVIKVDRVVHKSGVTGNVGRVVLVLAMANKAGGVSQKEVVDASSLPKDMICKLIGSLVDDGMIEHSREGAHSRTKRLTITDQGRKLLSEVNASLQTPRPIRPATTPHYEELSLHFGPVGPERQGR